MKIYFVVSATAENYIMAECSDGIRCNNCAPDGRFAGVDLIAHSDADATLVCDAIRENIDPDIDESDLEWMGDPCYATIEEWKEDQERFEPFDRDDIYLVFETSANPEMLTYRVYRYTDASESDQETLAEIPAEDASSAIEAYCNKPKYDPDEDVEYTWRFKISLIDADTRGKTWARASVDTDGGINWNETVYAELVEVIE